MQSYSRWKTYEKAREYVRELKFKNPAEYLKWSTTPDRPYDIPTTPAREYKDNGWVNWTDYLGTKLTYEEAKEAIVGLGIRTKAEYFNRADELPRGVARQPQRTYKDKGWNGWREYLGRQQ